ncbi:hypothetical protein GGR54DRAFT_593340 [Hypoxylon sp. NC1633]|nr:hypothetical protein GGR54DRAFT_593340 [Hypoxylon sp. NC1633]
MKLRPISVVSLLSHLWSLTAAEFRNRFQGITHGSDLLLQWDPVDAADHPLVIHSRLINQTGEYGVNALEVTITADLNSTSFLWQSAPYPLPFFESAKYEVEVWSQNWVPTTSKPAFATSSYFTISEPKDEDANGSNSPLNGSMMIPSNPTIQPLSNGGVNNTTAIAAGLVVPVVVILAILGFIWTQQRQKKIVEEKRKQRENLYID